LPTQAPRDRAEDRLDVYEVSLASRSAPAVRSAPLEDRVETLVDVPDPRFPLRYVDEEGTNHLLGDVSEIEQTVEFLDDFDRPYLCHDAQGHRVRLIVWALRLLVCQIVPEEFAPGELTIAEEVDGDRIFESLGQLPVRAITGDGRIEPASWEQKVRRPARTLMPAGLRVEDFHQRWMTARLGSWP